MQDSIFVSSDCTVLLDVEGTTSSIEFVYDIMFPFAKRNMPEYLAMHFDDPDLREALNQVALDAKDSDLNSKLAADDLDKSIKAKFFADHLVKLMEADSKTTGLKAVQGLVWRSGFESGELKSHLFEDVFPALERLKKRGCDLRIYSSGSVVAQKLFFGHTEFGDITEFFSAHYDTTIGSKRNADSYQQISLDVDKPASKIFFLSDVAAELDASSKAGMRSVAVVRPGNVPLPGNYDGPMIKSFDALI